MKIVGIASFNSVAKATFILSKFIHKIVGRTRHAFIHMACAPPAVKLSASMTSVSAGCLERIRSKCHLWPQSHSPPTIIIPSTATVLRPPPNLAPPSFSRRKPSAHGTSSLLRYLFPHTRQRARARLSKFRLETLPAFRHRTQSRIYRYIVYRQSLKLRRKPGILQRLRGHTRKLLGNSYLENEALRRRYNIAAPGGSDAPKTRSMSGQEYYGAREPGARRRKLAGYLKAANDLRQSYTSQYAPGWSRREGMNEYEDDTPGGFPDAAIVRSGDEEMILFPSYARKHVKNKVGDLNIGDRPEGCN